MNAYLVIFFIFRVKKTSSAKERYTYKDPIGLAGLFQNHLIHPDGKPRFKRNTSSIPLKMFTGCWCGSWWVIKGIVRRTVCHPNLVYTLATVLSPLFFFQLIDWNHLRPLTSSPSPRPLPDLLMVLSAAATKKTKTLLFFWALILEKGIQINRRRGDKITKVYTYSFQKRGSFTAKIR